MDNGVVVKSIVDVDIKAKSEAILSRQGYTMASFIRKTLCDLVDGIESANPDRVLSATGLTGGDAA